MNETIKGIVIGSVDYKDNDAIITVSAENYGRISLYVRGYKKITSKNVYATQLFDLSNFLVDYNDSKDIQILKSASLIDEFTAIKSDYTKIAIASIMCEIAGALEDEDMYPLLMDALQKLDKGNQPYLVLNVFMATILSQLGISPCVDGCVLCGNTNSIEAISLEEGGFVCHSCNLEIKAEKSSVNLLKKFRIINKASFSVMDKLLNLNMDDFKLTDLLVNNFVMYSGINLKSYKSLTNLNS